MTTIVVANKVKVGIDSKHVQNKRQKATGKKKKDPQCGESKETTK
jgi:hypothetical protein